MKKNLFFPLYLCFNNTVRTKTLDFIDVKMRIAYNMCVKGNEVILLKWSKLELMSAPDQTISFYDEITFEPSAFSKLNQIRGLRKVTVSGELHYDEEVDRAYAQLHVSGVMILACAITNEDVDYDFQTSATEVFAFTKCDDDVHEAKGDVIELLPVIFQLILMEAPLKVVKPGATYPKGNGWEVMREDTWQREKSRQIDPRLAKLKEFKVTDDEAGGANNGSTAKT